MYVPYVYLCFIYKNSKIFLFPKKLILPERRIFYPLQKHMKKLTYKKKGGGPWVAQSGKHLSLEFGSGHDLRVMRLSPALGSMLGVEPVKILCLSAPPPLIRECSFSLSKKK